jgi:hypothetical protein
MEVWKSINVEGYPIVMDPYSRTANSSTLNLRLKPTRMFNDTSRLVISKYSFNMDSAKTWNLAPLAVTRAETLTLAKKAILAHAKTLKI